MNAKRNTPARPGSMSFGEFVDGVRGTSAGRNVAADLADVLGS